MKSLLFFLIGITLFSCAKKEKGGSEPASKPFYVSELAPMYFTKELCEKSYLLKPKKDDFNISYDLQVMDKNEVITHTKRVDLFENIFQMSSYGFLNKMTYNDKYKLSLFIRYNEFIDDYFVSGESKTIFDKAGKTLDICIDEDTNYFGKYSYEGMGFSFLYGINKAYDLFKNARPDIKLSDVSVKAAPLVSAKLIARGGPKEKEFKNAYMYLADNAGYSSKEKAILIFPQSKSKFDEGAEPLWSYPFIGAHEYGHHVFMSLFDEFVSEYNMNHSHDHVSCFTDEKNYKLTKVQASKVSKRKLHGSLFSFASLNEAVADLFAYYATGDEHKISGLSCFESSREVDSQYTATYLDKIITNKSLKILDSHEVIDQSFLDCNDLDFQEVHSVGSVIAYNLNKLLDKYLDNKEDKVITITKLINKLNNEYESYEDKSSSETIEKIMISTLDILSSEDDRQVGCDVIDNMFEKSVNCELK